MNERIIASQIGVSETDLLKQALLDMRQEMHVLSSSMVDLLTKINGSDANLKSIKDRLEAQRKQKTPEQISEELLKQFKDQREKDKKETIAKIQAEFKVLGEKFSGGVTSARSVASDAFGYFAKDHSQPLTHADIQKQFGASIQGMLGGISKMIAPSARQTSEQKETLLPTFQDFQKTTAANHKELSNKIDLQNKNIQSTVAKLLEKMESGKKLSDSDIRSLAREFNKEVENNDNKSAAELAKEKKLRELDAQKDKIIAEQESKLKILKEKFSGGMTAIRSLASDAFGYFAQDHSKPTTHADINQSFGQGLQKAFGYIGAKIQPRYTKDKKPSGETPLPEYDPSMGEPMPRTLGEEIKKDTEKAIELISNDMRNEMDTDEDNDAVMRKLARKVDGIDNEADNLANDTAQVDSKVERLENYVRYQLVDEIVAKLKGSGLGGGEDEGGGMFDTLLDLLDMRKGGRGGAAGRKGGRVGRALRKAKLAFRKSRVGRGISAAKRGISRATSAMGRAASKARSAVSLGNIGARSMSALRSAGSASAGAVRAVGSGASSMFSKFAASSPRLMSGLGKVGSVLGKASAFVAPAMAAYGAIKTGFNREERGKEAMRLSNMGTGGRIADTLGLGNVGENYKQGILKGTLYTGMDILGAPVQWGKNIGTAGGLIYDTMAAKSQKSDVESKNADRIKNMASDDYEQSVGQFKKPMPDGKEVSDEVARAAAVSQALRKMSIGPAMMASQSEGAISAIGSQITSLLSTAAADLMVDTRTGKINVDKAKAALNKLKVVSNMWGQIKDIVQKKEDPKSNLGPDVITKGDLFYLQLLPQRLSTIENYISNLSKPKKEAAPKVETEKSKSKATQPSTAQEKNDDAFSRMDKALETGKPIEPPAGYKDASNQLKSNIEDINKSTSTDKSASSVNDIKTSIVDQNQSVMKALNDLAAKVEKASFKERPPVQHLTPPDYSMLNIQSLSKGLT